MRWAMGVGWGLVVLVLVIGVALGVGAWRHQRSRSAQWAHLAAGGPGVPTPPTTEAAPLPPIVERALARALGGQPPPEGLAVLAQRAAIRGKPGEPWRELTAAQALSADPPGFVWSAAVPLLPGLNVYATDALIAGEGSLTVSLAGLVTIARATGPEMTSGELHRFLAETVWLPQVWRTAHLIRWEAAGPRRARATLSTAGTTVSGVFEFDAQGRPLAYETEARAREVDGRYEPTPFRGTFAGHRRLGGVEIPTEVRVFWLLPEGPFEYFRGTVESLEFRRPDALR